VSQKLKQMHRTNVVTMVRRYNPVYDVLVREICYATDFGLSLLASFMNFGDGGTKTVISDPAVLIL